MRYLAAKRDAAGTDPLFADVPMTPDVMQYHYDEIARLPPGAVLLMTGTGYPNQAFRVGRAAWGVQFHIETSAADVRAWGRSDPDGPTGADRQRAEATGRLGPMLDEAEEAMAVVWRDVARRFVDLAGHPRPADEPPQADYWVAGSRCPPPSLPASPPPSSRLTQAPVSDRAPSPAPAIRTMSRPASRALAWYGLPDDPRVIEDLRTAGLATNGITEPGAEPVLAALSRTGRPELAVGALASVVKALRAAGRSADPAGELLRVLRSSAGFRGRLLGVLGGSATLGDHLIGHPEQWHLLRDDRAGRRVGDGRTEGVGLDAARWWFTVATSPSRFRRALAEAVGLDPMASLAPARRVPGR